MSTAQPTLLIVDDEIELRSILSEICEELTPNILTASDGRAALDIVKQQKVHAILSDLNMPFVNGLQLLAEIRSMGSETPFVILTAYGDRKSTAEALRLGATAYLDKPFDQSDVLEAVKHALSLGTALEEAEAHIEKLYQNVSLPADQWLRLKRARRGVWLMKMKRELHQKKSS